MIRRADPLNVYLLRHAEAYKNLDRVHGGGDQRLTTVGEGQARALGKYLLGLHGSEGLQVVHQPEGRSRATAQRIGKTMSKGVAEVPDLVGVDLGIVSGLSEQELVEGYPEVAAALINWRTNKGDLRDRPHVPGSEKMEDFAMRINRGLTTSIQSRLAGTALAIVGTTSTLNMINHLLINDGDFNRAHYDFIEFPLGGLAGWQISDTPPMQIMAMTHIEGREI